MPGEIWYTCSVIAGAISIIGPLFLVYSYVRTVTKRIKDFGQTHESNADSK
jgi:hypothetical protein